MPCTVEDGFPGDADTSSTELPSSSVGDSDEHPAVNIRMVVIVDRSFRFKARPLSKEFPHKILQQT